MTSMDELPFEIARAPAEVQKHYRKVIALGYGERWASMCALQIAPGTKGTDRTFFEGRYNQQQFDDMPKLQAQNIIREAKAAGIDISGKYYHSGIADKRRWTDPEAWVSSTDDVIRVCKKRHMTITGAINYDSGEPLPPKRKVLHEDIVNEEVAKAKKKNPGLKDTPELRRSIVEKHAHPSKLKGK